MGMRNIFNNEGDDMNNIELIGEGDTRCDNCGGIYHMDDCVAAGDAVHCEDCHTDLLEDHSFKSVQ